MLPLYCPATCLRNADASGKHPASAHTLSLSLFLNSHSHIRQISAASQPASQLQSVRRLNISQWAETWQRRRVHLNAPLCETRGRQIKHRAQNVTHTQTHTSEEVSDGRILWAGIVWLGCLPLWDEQCHLFSLRPYFMRVEAAGRDWSVTQGKECLADVSSHFIPLPHSVFFFLFLILSLCLFSSFLPTVRPPLIFSPCLWLVEAPQSTPRRELGLKGCGEHMSYY